MDDCAEASCLLTDLEVVNLIIEEACEGMGAGELGTSSGDAEASCEAGEAATSKVSSGSMNKVEVTADFVNSVCAEYAEDQNLSTAHRSFFKNIQGEGIVDAMAFMNNCIVPLGKFRSATREKALIRYHQAFIKHRREVAQATGGNAINVAFLCLKIFEALLTKAYPKCAGNVERQCARLSEQDKDVLSHIGGAILQKQKRLFCNIVVAMESDSSEAIERSLTKTLDRGGLIYLTDDANLLFQALETKFRDLVAQGCNIFKLSEFERMCWDDQGIVVKFEECTQASESPDSEKKAVLSAILDHFFRIRMHHECRLYKEKNSAHVSAKGDKALRKVLKKYEVKIHRFCVRLFC